MKKLFPVELFVDGACSGNGSPNAMGGYAAIVTYKDKAGEMHEKVVAGWEANATNNRMELRAVIEGVKAVVKPSEISVFTDSLVIIHQADMLRQKRKPANPEYWQQLIDAAHQGGHHLSFHHVRGHAGHPLNERCDQLARWQATSH